MWLLKNYNFTTPFKFNKISKLFKLSIIFIPLCYTFSVSKTINIKNNKLNKLHKNNKLKLINNKFKCMKNTTASIFELFVILDIMLPLYFE